MNQEEAQIYATGFQFIKQGIALDFIADTASFSVIMKGKTGQLTLTLSEAGRLRDMINQVIDVVVAARDIEIEAGLKKVDFDNLPELK